MRKSTRRMFKKHGWRVDRAIHNYIYFAFYYPYVKVVLFFLNHILKYLTWFKPLQYVGDMAFSRYHGKIMRFEDTRKIFELNEDLTAISEENKRIIPFKYATKVIFEEPDYIAVMDCPCKKSYGDGAMEPICCCLAVGRETASFWLDHGKKYHARKITQSEALDLIRECRATGHIIQAFLKVATGGRTGVICNCHPDSCVSIIASKMTREIRSGLTQYIDSGYSVSHNQETCVMCGTCAEICPFDAISCEGGIFTYDKAGCMGCGLCEEHCPNGSLILYMDSEKTLPLDLDMIRMQSSSQERKQEEMKPRVMSIEL